LISVANKDNSKSSSIKLTWVGEFATSFLHFKHMIMAYNDALDNNQWLLNWFKTQTIREK
jgi:hypothetical protein